MHGAIPAIPHTPPWFSTSTKKAIQLSVPSACDTDMPQAASLFKYGTKIHDDTSCKTHINRGLTYVSNAGRVNADRTHVCELNITQQ